MKRTIILLMFLLPMALFAMKNKNQISDSSSSILPISQKEMGSPEVKKITSSIEIQNLFSTHGTNFKGFGLIESYHLSPLFSLGLGAEYSWCGYHFDNGLSLTDLKFLAVYLDSKMNLTRGRKLTPFLHLSTGVTFENYRKQKQDPYYLPSYGPVTPGSEQGLYLYSGAGVSIKITKKLHAYIDAGFKGYHMSFYDLDINPHGVNLKAGLTF